MVPASTSTDGSVWPLRGIAVVLFGAQLSLTGAIVEFFLPTALGVLIGLAGALIAFNG